LCSGTLIAADAVLSAAHCFDSMRPGLAYEVFAGASLDPESPSVAVLEVVTNPGFDPESRENDVAVLWLAAPLEVANPEPLPPPGSPPPELEDPVTLAGFGATSAGLAPDGVKRVGAGRVGGLGTGTVQVDPDPSLSCVGDSGGPLFDDSARLIGVASSGDTGCSETSIYALIAPTMDGFIEPTLAMGPTERPPVADACESGCVTDADCPAGFVCIADAQSNVFRCAFPGQEPGTLGQRCSQDAECSDGFCAQSATASDCRCYQPCATAAPNNASGGCSVAHGEGAAGLAWLMGLLLALSARTKR
jgi:hypothetical protein